MQANVIFKKKRIGAPFIFKNSQLKKPVNIVPTEFDKVLEDIIKIKSKNRIITNEQYNIAKKQWAAVLSQYTSLWKFKHGCEFASQIAHIALWNALKRFETGRNCSWKSYLHATMNWEYSAQTRVSVVKSPINCSLQNIELDPSDSEILESNLRIKEEFGEAIEKLCKFLNPQEKDILLYRIKGFKLDEIGKIHKISKERVRQVQEKIASKAKNMVYKKLITF
jgi:RNA polymerase sigma factor (sigma-70 family)